MATRTISVTGGTRNWNDTASWVEGAVPTAADDVVATAVSGALTINVAAACRSIDLTGYTGTLTHNAFTLSVGDASGGALTFPASGWTYTKSSTTSSAISFVSTSNNGGTGWGITTGGKVLGNVIFNGVGGKWVFQDNFSANGATSTQTTLTNGTLDMNGKTVGLGQFASNNSNTRTLTMGAAAITLSGGFVGGGGAWDVAGTTNLTVTSNTATITMTGGFLTRWKGGSINWNGLTLVFNGLSQRVLEFAGTLANLTMTGGNDQISELRLTGNITVTGTFTAAGNSAAVNRLFIASDTPGTPRTITCNTTVTASNVDFMDIVGAGSASWNLSAISGGSGDCLGNSGITFTTAKTLYGVAPNGWSTASSWSATSGGAGGAGTPLPQDDLFLNASSGAGTYQLNMVRYGRNLDCTGFTGTLQIFLNPGSTVNGYGNFKTVAGMAGLTSNCNLNLAGRGAQTLTSGGKSYPTVVISAPGGSYTLQDAFTCGGANGFQLAFGTFDTNGQTLTTTTMDTQTGTFGTRSLILGTSTVNLTNTSGLVWSVPTFGGTLTVSAASATIVIQTASSSSRTFHSRGYSYGTLTYTVAASTGALVLTDAGTFGTINVSGGARTLTLTTATVTIVGTFNVFGTSGNLITINSSSAGSTTTELRSTSAAAKTLAYVSVKDIKGTYADGAATLPSLSNLKSQWKADGTLWQDSARTSPATADGHPVGSWDDASGTGNHALQATSGKRPILRPGQLGGKPALRFDGVDDILQTAAAVSTVTDNWTMFFACQPLDTNTGNGRAPFWNGGSAAGYGIATIANAGKKGFLRTGAWENTTTNADTLAGLYTGQMVSGTRTLYFNGTALSPTFTGATGTPDPSTRLGGHNLSVNECVKIDIAEALFYEAALSSTDRQAVETYLLNKYALIGTSGSWYADPGGVDGGNNTGWTFGPAVTNITATPATVVTVAAVPTPTLSIGVTVIPATVAAVAAVPVPAVQTGSTVTPATVIGVAAVSAPTTSAGTSATATPSTVAGIGAVPAPSVQTGSTIAVTTVAGVAAVPAPTTGAGTTASPATVVGVAAVPTPTIQTGTSATATPAQVATAAAVPAPATQTGSTVTPSTVVGVAAVPAPTTSAAVSAQASPSTVVGAASVPSPAVQTGVGATPGPVAAVAAVPAPTPGAGATASPATVVGVAAVPAPTASATKTVTALPGVVAAIAGIPVPAVTLGQNVSPATVACFAFVPDPTVVALSAPNYFAPTHGRIPATTTGARVVSSGTKTRVVPTGTGAEVS